MIFLARKFINLNLFSVYLLGFQISISLTGGKQNILDWESEKNKNKNEGRGIVQDKRNLFRSNNLRAFKEKIADPA